jgi:CBS domain-containing protein
MQIKDVMTKGPLSVRGDGTIQEAAAGMRSEGIGALPVVNTNDQLIGMVTDRDITIRAVAEGFGPETVVEKVMTRRLIAAEASKELEHALSVMGEHQIRRLPVVDGERLVGILAQADIAAVTDPLQVAETLRRLSEPAASEVESR